MCLALCAADVVLCALAHQASMRTRPGSSSRAALLLPLAAALFALPVLALDGAANPVLAQSFCCIMSMSAFKIIALSAGRGCLAAREQQTAFGRFLLVCLLPVIPAPSEPVLTDWRQRLKEAAAKLRHGLASLVSAVTLAALSTSAIQAADTHLRGLAADASLRIHAATTATTAANGAGIGGNRGYLENLMPLALVLMVRTVSYFFLGVALMLEVTGMGDLVDMVPLLALGQRVELHFDEAWKAASFAELWSRRWNITVTGVLRPVCYDPVMEGRWAAAEPPPLPPPPPSGPAPSAPTPPAAPAATVAASAATESTLTTTTQSGSSSTSSKTSCGRGGGEGDGGGSRDDTSPLHFQNHKEGQSQSPTTSSIPLPELLASLSPDASSHSSSDGSSCSPGSDVCSSSFSSISGGSSGSPALRNMLERAWSGDGVDGGGVDGDDGGGAGGGCKSVCVGSFSAAHRRRAIGTSAAEASDAVPPPVQKSKMFTAATPAPPNELNHQSRRRGQSQPRQPRTATAAAPSGSQAANLHRSSRARRFAAVQMTFLVSGLWHELVCYSMSGTTTGGSWLLLFALQAPLILVESELRHKARKLRLRVPRAIKCWIVHGLLFLQLMLLWYPPMERTGMLEGLTRTGDRVMAAAAAAAAVARRAITTVAALLPAATEATAAALTSGSNRLEL